MGIAVDTLLLTSLKSWLIWKIPLFFRGRGGVEAEREERERWIDHERRKIQDSVKGQGQPISVCLPGAFPSVDIKEGLFIDNIVVFTL